MVNKSAQLCKNANHMNQLKKITLLLLIGILTQSFSAFSQGYEIKVKISTLKDSTLILGHFFAKAGAFFADDTVKLDKTGTGVFKDKKILPKGLYIILLPSKKYFDFAMGTDQVFSIEADTSDLAKKIKFTGSQENTVMYDYRNFITERSTIAQKLYERKRSATDKVKADSITKAIDNMNKEVMAYIANMKKANPDLFFVKFIKSIEEIDVPDFPRDANGKVLDSLFQAKYYRAHYFDNFNIADPDLIRTPLYEPKLTTYIEKVVPPMPDTLNMEIDKILEKVKENKELFQYILGTFYNKFGSSQIMGHDGVFVHVAEQWYLPYATWSDSTFKANLKKDIAKLKPNLLGNTAPNLMLIQVPTDHFKVAQIDTALKSNPNVGAYFRTNDIPAKFTILAFWEADCGHCKKAIPELYEVYNRIKDKGVQVIAMHMIASIEGKRKWIDFVNEHQLYDWINAWSPASYEYKDLYNVYSTPVIYVLDQNKKIIAKRLSPDQIEEVINFELKRKK
jgi:thiol-disulfide isomerase/thioredoxin